MSCFCLGYTDRVIVTDHKENSETKTENENESNEKFEEVLVEWIYHKDIISQGQEIDMGT